MSKIVINDIEYTDDVDKRFTGCEFCDVRSLDYYYYKRNCLCAYSADDKPCGNARYLKRISQLPIVEEPSRNDVENEYKKGD